jgi:hypothetical protein
MYYHRWGEIVSIPVGLGIIHRILLGLGIISRILSKGKRIRFFARIFTPIVKR